MKIDAKSPDGNAFVIMGRVSKLLREVGRGEEWPQIQKKMMDGDYRNLCKIAEEVTNGSITVVNLDGEDD